MYYNNFPVSIGVSDQSSEVSLSCDMFWLSLSILKNFPTVFIPTLIVNGVQNNNFGPHWLPFYVQKTQMFSKNQVWKDMRVKKKNILPKILTNLFMISFWPCQHLFYPQNMDRMQQVNVGSVDSLHLDL